LKDPLYDEVDIWGAPQHRRPRGEIFFLLFSSTCSALQRCWKYRQCPK
jgi:hypothetical protein